MMQSFRLFKKGQSTCLFQNEIMYLLLYQNKVNIRKQQFKRSVFMYPIIDFFDNSNWFHIYDKFPHSVLMTAFAVLSIGASSFLKVRGLATKSKGQKRSRF